MHFTTDIQAKATAELYSHLEQQVWSVAPEPIKVRTPQRKAKYHDKTRVRLCDIKMIALRDCKCSDTTEMKRRLKILGINLDLRLTAAWIAIAWELQHQIKAVPPLVPELPSNEKLLELAVSLCVIAKWIEDEEGGLYWIWKTPEKERQLVTPSGIAMYLRQLVNRYKLRT